MYKRYYDGYSRPAVAKDSGEIVVPESLPAVAADEIKPEITSSDPGEISVSGMGGRNSLLSLPFELDDIILIGILLFLLFDKSDDKKDDDNDIFMLLIIGFIIFSDIF